jgi:hypothetical protein
MQPVIVPTVSAGPDSRGTKGAIGASAGRTRCPVPVPPARRLSPGPGRVGAVTLPSQSSGHAATGESAPLRVSKTGHERLPPPEEPLQVADQHVPTGDCGSKGVTRPLASLAKT